MPNCAGCQKAAACDVCVDGYRLNADNSTCISESFLLTNHPGSFSKHIASTTHLSVIRQHKHMFIYISLTLFEGCVSLIFNTNTLIIMMT